MMRFGLRCVVLIGACLFIGCGSGSGIESGIPKDAAPAEATPDMGPDPAGKRTKMP
ncbi:hypothetical protein V5E97_22950 [Singulisphaera sp. Ch08]|uniref:Lipoprotein n=1 Tax=Singulisphaera sp. Ch08 TaxID=3120278 RepID=A0AAU7C740_9BACT